MAIFTITTDSKTNQRPTVVGDNKKELDNGETYVFTIASLTTETQPVYRDPENDPINRFKLVSESFVNGGLFLNGAPVSVNDEIIALDIENGLLTYVDDGIDTSSHQSYFEYTLSDTGSSEFCLDTGLFTFGVNALTNSPATVGDATESIGYKETLIFTRAMFTSATTPPYNDPEGDVADKLKITALPTDGMISFNGVFVTVNQIIDFSDIDSGLLTYAGSADEFSDPSSTFSFQIADAGSGEFVG